MTLYSRPACPHCHRVRFVLAEKGIAMDIINIEGHKLPEDLLELNPYNSVPTLVDRELALYDPRIIMEYLDERFPHPPLMPVDPVARARFRLALYRIERDWYSLVDEIEQSPVKPHARAKKLLRESLLAAADAFSVKPYFLSDEFSLVDCSVAPILWRLPRYEIDLPAQARNIGKYAERIFNRPAFKSSLTEIEREMRDAA
ncbi:MAG: glutathione S-transferase N-terminal domain-containing protein [Gammaproteobacteria bacterium]|nr:glutathione S-transferase N-terminal domain-containing protein [Gammaproteobacteria bacterium]